MKLYKALGCLIIKQGLYEPRLAADGRREEMRMFDGCCGMKGASQAMWGWTVITLDNDPKFVPDICMDIRLFDPSPYKSFDFMWFSPPCDEFSREFMPWCKTGKNPDMSIFLACLRIIKECEPRYWCIENVRGAMKWFAPYIGKPKEIQGPFHLWGNFPPLGKVKLNMRKKESMSSSWAAQRAKIPYALSLAMKNAIELQEGFDI